MAVGGGNTDARSILGNVHAVLLCIISLTILVVLVILIIATNQSLATLQLDEFVRMAEPEPEVARGSLCGLALRPAPLPSCPCD